MPAQMGQAALFGLVKKDLGQPCVGQLKADIDRRAILDLLRAVVEIAAVDVAVQQRAFLSSIRCHCLSAASLLDPAQHQCSDIQGEGRWCIETALLLGLDRIAERGWETSWR